MLVRPASQAAYILALASASGVGPWTAVAISRAFPDPARLFAASIEDLECVLGKRFARSVAAIDSADWPQMLAHGDSEVARHQEAGIAVLAIDDPGYPPLMGLAKRPAAILFCRGEVESIRTADTVAIVGTRQPTAAGYEVARRLARYLADAGFTIVSGLARGIDAAGHQATLEAEGRTVAILGTAVDQLYPASSRGLGEAILAGGGAVISEYPIGTPSAGRLFVERDRLQAAMSIAVIAIQTDIAGGTMHTVGFAIEYQRPVLVPRPLSSEGGLPAYRGIWAMIGDGRAYALASSDDYPRLTEYLKEHRDWLMGDRSPPRPRFAASMEPDLTADTLQQQSVFDL